MEGVGGDQRRRTKEGDASKSLWREECREMLVKKEGSDGFEKRRRKCSEWGCEKVGR